MGYNNVNASDGPGGPMSVSGSTEGDENEISCGGPEYHFDSESGALAQFHPQFDPNLKT